MTKPLDMQVRAEVDGNCFGLNMNRAIRVIGKRFDAALRPLGINNWQFSLLMALYRPDGLTVNELASVLVVDRTTITANLKPLERMSLLAVTVDIADARVRRIRLTPAGIGMLEQAYPIWQSLTGEIKTALGHHQSSGMIASLVAISSLPH